MENQNTQTDNQIITLEDEPKEDNNKLAIAQQQQNDFYLLPSKADIDRFKNFLNDFDNFIKEYLVEKVDYGVIPGVEKPTLLKPGAEKMEKLFFLTHRKERLNEGIIITDNFIKYTYKTIVYDRNGKIKATCEGSCNSKESKYRYTSVSENKATPEDKRIGERIEKNGKYGKYWTYRIERQDVFDIENTIMKMAQKRSYVGAILEATGSSGRFTQDVEDMDMGAVNGYQNNNKQNFNKQNYNNKQSSTPYQPPPQPPKTDLQTLSDILNRAGAKTPQTIREYIENKAGITLEDCREIDEAKAKEILEYLGKK